MTSNKSTLSKVQEVLQNKRAKRSKFEKNYDLNDIDFVYKNSNKMTAGAMAEARGLALAQVRGIIYNLKHIGLEMGLKVDKRPTNKSLIEEFVNRKLKQKR